MKNLKNIFSLYILLAFLLAGCGGKAVQDNIISEQPQETNTSDRGFNPLELSGDTEIIPVKFPAKGEIRGATEIITPDSLNADLTLSVINDVPNNFDTMNSQAFRVQIFTSKLYGDSRKAVKVAEEIFDRPVFVDYEVPYYKVRVGNFATRDEAEEYQLRTKAAGYSTAWVVMVNIAVKETAPLYDEDYPEEFDESTIIYEGIGPDED